MKIGQNFENMQISSPVFHILLTKAGDFWIKLLLKKLLLDSKTYFRRVSRKIQNAFCSEDFQ